jgi:hypothetical protein
MEVVFALPLLLIPIALPFLAGMIARQFGRSYKLWFWISIPFPFVAHMILLCLPDLNKKIVNETCH